MKMPISFIAYRKQWIQYLKNIIFTHSPIKVEPGGYFVYAVTITKNNDGRSKRVHVGITYDPRGRLSKIKSTIKMATPSSAEEILFNSGWLENAKNIHLKMDILDNAINKEDAINKEVFWHHKLKSVKNHRIFTNPSKK